MTRVEVFSDRTDVRTLPPMLNTLSWWHQTGYEEVVADAGYESMENYLYLDQNRQMYFIKPTNHSQKKSRNQHPDKFKELLQQCPRDPHPIQKTGGKQCKNQKIRDIKAHLRYLTVGKETRKAGEHRS